MSRSPNVFTFNAGVEKETRPKNPNIQVLLDEIMNDSSTDKSLSIILQTIPKNILSQKTVLLKLPSTAAAAAAAVACAIPSPSPPTEVIAAVFQVKPELIPEIITPIKEKQRMKGDIIGFSDVDDGDDFDSDESIDIIDIKPKVKFLDSYSDIIHTTRKTRAQKRNCVPFR